MFTNGYISRGINTQKRMSTEERIYLYCRGRKNVGVTGGWETAGYSNEMNARVPEAPKERDTLNSWADVTRWLIFPSPSASEQASNCFVIGTCMQIDTSLKRYLVIEGKAGINSATDMTVKLSRTKDLEDDGQYNLEFETEYRKRYIDLREDGNISGMRYIVLATGLNGWTNPTEYDIKRVYLTNEKESDIEVLYNRGDNKNIAMWQESSRSQVSPVFQNDCIDMYSTDNRGCEIITARNIKNLHEKKYLGILYNGIEINSEAQSGILFSIIEAATGTQRASGGNKPSTGLNRQYFGIERYGDIFMQPMDYQIEVEVNASHKIKILAIWLE